MTSRDADHIIDTIEMLTKLKENGDILDYFVNWDEKSKVLNISTVPLSTPKYSHIDFMITPNGIEFNG